MNMEEMERTVDSLRLDVSRLKVLTFVVAFGFYIAVFALRWL